MALTRPELRKIGVTEKEMLDFIMDEHNLALDAIKESLTTATTDLTNANKKIKELESAPPADSNGDGKDWKSEYENIKGEFDTYKTSVETEKTTSAKRAAVRQALKDLGAHDEDLDTFLLDKVDYDKVVLDGDKVKDPKAFDGYKEQYKRYFGDTVTVGAGVATPPKADGGVLNPFMQEHFSLEAQTKLFRENPQLARDMAAAVGIKIN